jgi:hypothetical protein
MCLNVSLINHIQPSSVAQVIEPGIIRVVACSHCIEVKPLCLAVCVHVTSTCMDVRKDVYSVSNYHA